MNDKLPDRAYDQLARYMAQDGLELTDGPEYVRSWGWLAYGAGLISGTRRIRRYMWNSHINRWETSATISVSNSALAALNKIVEP